MSVFDASMVPMVDMFLYETTTLLEQLDEILLQSEQSQEMTTEDINEIFRIMHTIKGSAAMMGLSAFSKVAHRVEDMFFIVRDNSEIMKSMLSRPIFDILFQSSDFFKTEVEGIQNNIEEYAPTNPTELIDTISAIIPQLKGEVPIQAAPEVPVQPVLKQGAGEQPTAQPKEETPKVLEQQEDVVQEAIAGGEYKIRIFFEDGCQMENIRAFMLITQLKGYCEEITSVPANPETSSDYAAEIIKNGLLLKIKTSLPIENIYSVIESSVNIKSYENVSEHSAPPSAVVTAAAAEHRGASVSSGATGAGEAQIRDVAPASEAVHKAAPSGAGKQSMISVNQTKLNQLMDIMGEIVIAESMVANSPELKNLQLDNFSKSTRQLRKLTDQLQDIVMSIRMVPLTGVFQKMNLIVRDMNRKLGKEVVFKTFGGETEIDKTINDVLADPFMHMIRNAMDHAIESPEERINKGKPEMGTITLGAQNIGGEIVITIADDGRGLDRDKLLAKAKKNGLLTKPEAEHTDKEAFQLIMMAGFSTNEVVTEFSGRGVGMDVVRQNIEKVNGSISVESQMGQGTTFTIKIPLTLAIVDGMEVAVSDGVYIIPITSIRQTFKLGDGIQLLQDTEGSEMVMLRGTCLPIIRLHKIYDAQNAKTNLEDGIFILIENDRKAACLFVDELLGEQQVVVKPFPAFLSKYSIKGNGLAGCTIMGDGSISLILDANNLLNNF
ncbi:chemotaxis protein CheW [Oscillospiraceae bacterium LTW-04]|nr:chemotaxis protein CheA [Oscillospiraceae bacterium MB24-C1]